MENMATNMTASSPHTSMLRMPTAKDDKVSIHCTLRGLDEEDIDLEQSAADDCYSGNVSTSRDCAYPVAVSAAAAAAASQAPISWTRDSIDTLLDAMQMRPCLWNNKLDVYTNRREKHNALAEMDETMSRFNIPRAIYRKKWTILRGQFQRELSREKRSTSGFVSQWKWFTRMFFLKECTDIDIKVFDASDGGRTAKKAAVVPIAPIDIVNSSNKLEQSSMYSQADISRNINIPNDVLNDTHFVSASMTTTLPPCSVSSVVSLAPSSSHVCPIPHSTEESEDRLTQQSTSTVSFNSRSEEDIFGMMIAKTLQRLAPMQRALARKRIGDVLYEVEVGALQGPAERGPPYNN